MAYATYTEMLAEFGARFLTGSGTNGGVIPDGMDPDVTLTNDLAIAAVEIDAALTNGGYALPLANTTTQVIAWLRRANMILALDVATARHSGEKKVLAERADKVREALQLIAEGLTRLGDMAREQRIEFRRIDLPGTAGSPLDLEAVF